MRRSLGILLLLAVLSACGSDDGSGSEANDPAASTGESEPGPDWSQVALLSSTNGRGEVTEVGTALPDDAAVAAFTEPLDPGLATEVADAAGAAVVPDGQALYGAVVSLDCDPPTAVTVTRSDGDVLVRPRTEKASPGVQCLAAVTTVALVLVDEPA